MLSVAHPLLLLALPLLPLLWWLLRATPPAPRRQDFPAVRLLLGIEHREEVPDRTPPWLLALRLLAAASLVAGLADPMVTRAGGKAGRDRAPLLLVVDTGWATAHDWSRRVALCDRLLAAAAASGREAALLATARGEDDAPPALTAAMPAALLADRIAALRPQPWPDDRAGAARALDAARAARPDLAAATVDVVSDGLATPGDGPLREALHRFGPLRSFRDRRAARLLLAPRLAADGTLSVTLAAPAGSGRSMPAASLLALDDAGDALARVTFAAPAPVAGTDGRTVGETATLRLPAELRSRLSRLVVEGSHAAATTVLLDESDRRRPVGLVSTGAGNDTPLLGPLYYLSRAFPPGTPLRTGSVETLLARPLSVLVVPDGGLLGEGDRERVVAWVRAGGTLIRFAGPVLADADDDAAGVPGDDAGAPGAGDADADPLLPVALLPGTRALGGTMSWGRPQHIAPFPPSSPFSGLAVPREVTVSRQVLARPSATLASHTWASLDDGTPVVTEAALGAGRVVLFGVTANADWSNLPLSVLFVRMLDRLTRLASGLPPAGDRTLLAPLTVLDGFGATTLPGEAATGVAADQFGRVAASPRHPPGLYGAGTERRALNLADALAPPAASPDLAPPAPLGSPGTAVVFGPWLVLLALALLALDLAVTLGLRGLLPTVPRRRRPGARRGRAGASLGLLVTALGTGALALHPRPARAIEAGPVPAAALQTTLAYVVTGHADVDRISQQGLAALSTVVNARTAAVLGPPAGVVPGRDDLAFYPLLYWPITPDATRDPKVVAALDAYMHTGGIVLIDTEGGDAGAPGSGAGFAPGVGAALRRATAGLDVPPLSRLTPEDVLAHTFYLLRDFPGRFAGAPVWVQQRGDPANDGVSPVIIGADDWAASWAVGLDGNPAFAAIPGGDEQRTLSLRFGVNVVMYALTGNYKADQVHVPAILRRLGEGADGVGNAPEDGE